MTDVNASNTFQKNIKAVESSSSDNKDVCMKVKYVKGIEITKDIVPYSSNTSKTIQDSEFDAGNPNVASNLDFFNEFESQSAKHFCKDDFDITTTFSVRNSRICQIPSDSHSSVINNPLRATSDNCDSVSKCTLSKEPSLSDNTTKFSAFSSFLNKKHDEVKPKSSDTVFQNIPKQFFKKHYLGKEQEVFTSPETNTETQNKQMKTRLRSMWNNVKYGWRMKREVNLKPDSAIWILGQCYHNKPDGHSAPTQDIAVQFRQDLFSKIWLTYRINFPVIPNTNFTSDSGWGCMLRCGQMMMAQAFVCHFLQREWRLYDQLAANDPYYKMILRWFGDSLSEKSPFSLHHLVLLGENYGRKAGDWYGPTHVAHVLRDALLEAHNHHPALQSVCMYVASDGIVFKEDVFDLFADSSVPEEICSLSPFESDFAKVSLSDVQSTSCQETMEENPSINIKKNSFPNEELKSFENTCPSYSEFGPPSYSTVKYNYKSLILFVSVRLGNDKINPFYIPCLKSLLAYENCIGIIGGRPKHALYFIGFQDEKIIHMDPHLCQPAIDVEKEDFPHKSFHSMSIRTMSFSEMDPSCAIGFYFKYRQHFEIFIEKFSEITAPLKRNLEYPVFALADGKRINVTDVSECPSDKFTYTLRASNCDDEDDDYILL